jgi:hypothetical protein
MIRFSEKNGRQIDIAFRICVDIFHEGCLYNYKSYYHQEYVPGLTRMPKRGRN